MKSLKMIVGIYPMVDFILKFLEEHSGSVVDLEYYHEIQLDMPNTHLNMSVSTKVSFVTIHLPN